MSVSIWHTLTVIGSRYLIKSYQEKEKKEKEGGKEGEKEK